MRRDRELSETHGVCLRGELNSTAAVSVEFQLNSDAILYSLHVARNPLSVKAWINVVIFFRLVSQIEQDVQ